LSSLGGRRTSTTAPDDLSWYDEAQKREGIQSPGEIDDLEMWRYDSSMCPTVDLVLCCTNQNWGVAREGWQTSSEAGFSPKRQNPVARVVTNGTFDVTTLCWKAGACCCSARSSCEQRAHPSEGAEPIKPPASSINHNINREAEAPSLDLGTWNSTPIHPIPPESRTVRQDVSGRLQHSLSVDVTDPFRTSTAADLD
jgi:hypothetical protein